MTAFAVPLVFTIVAWWASTLAILWIDGLPSSTYRRSFAIASVVGVAALAGLASSAHDTSIAGAYCAFTCALLVWAWQEVAFLLGFVTGPRRTPCETSARGWRRAWLAFQAVMHHEVALVVLGVAVLASTWDAPNQTGWWTFAVLWAMRQSAKLNVFLGVRNLNENFLPAHLQYLHSYFVRRAMNPLLPVSVIGASLVLVPIFQAGQAPGASAFDATSLALVASLLGLAIVEHVMLVVPFPADLLWKWGLQSRARGIEPPRP